MSHDEAEQPSIPGPHASESLIIRNESLQVIYHPDEGAFQLVDRATGAAFVPRGKFEGACGGAVAAPAENRVFGSGESIVATGSGGETCTIVLYPGLPFALLRRTFRNPDPAPRLYNPVPLAMVWLDLGQPVSALTTLGTGGLQAPQDSSGSYVWLAVAEPRSRSGVVAGWLTGERASGVLFPGVDDSTVTITARCDYGRLLLDPGEAEESETLAIGWFDDARLGLEAWADTVARQLEISLPAKPDGFCTWLAEKHGGASDEDALEALAGFVAANLGPYGFDLVQIDDGWQLGDSRGNGPRKNFTGARPDGPYRSGMQKTALMLKQKGQMAGLWFMPFAGTHDDPWFADRQALFVKDADGAPFDTPWGGTSLDMTVLAARAYLRGILDRITREWGFNYIKMDGLYTGAGLAQEYVNYAYVDDNMGAAVFADPRTTGIETLRDGLRLVREAAPEVFRLGCCAPQNMRSYQGGFGLLDAMRTGADNAPDWDSWLAASPLTGSRHYHLNGRIWHNDPDPYFVRTSFTLDEARTTATWCAIAAGLKTSGDWIPDLPEERLDIIRRTTPVHNHVARPVDLFEHEPPRVWSVNSGQDRSACSLIALYNWDDSPAHREVELACCGLDPGCEYVGFDYWAGRFLPPFRGALVADLPAHGCKVVAVHPLVAHPFVLSTSRTVAQSLSGLSSELWDYQVLSAEIEVVGGDPCELRIYAPADPHGWTALKSNISPADHAAHAEIRFNQVHHEVRLTITCPESRTVAWRLFFAQHEPQGA